MNDIEDGHCTECDFVWDYEIVLSATGQPISRTVDCCPNCGSAKVERSIRPAEFEPIPSGYDV